MFAGLLITFLVAAFGYTTGTIIYVFAVPYAYLLLGVARSRSFYSSICANP